MKSAINLKSTLMAMMCVGMMMTAATDVVAQGQTWTPKASISSPRMMWAAGELNGALYAVGGWVGCTPYGNLEIYDPGANSWEQKAPMLTPRGYHAAGVLNGLLYVVGGTINCGVNIASVEAYDPDSNTWTAKNPLPGVRCNHCVAVADGTLYVIGGHDGNSGPGHADGAVLKYAPATDSWIPLPTAIPTPTPMR